MLAAIRASTPSKNSCVGEVGEGWGRGGQGHCDDSHTYDAMHKYKQDINEYDKLHFSYSDMLPSRHTISIQSILINAS